ncbi:MAG TPA: hypothetical protein VGR19_02255 [Allosphingosinicella sp.]|nr:hypothetical protein [Allosphingosinicella sp.]
MTEALTMILPEDVRDVWPTVRGRIAAIQEACDEPWLPEDVFNELVNAQAFLWGTEDLKGFLILQVPPQPYGRELHCWICCNETGEPPLAYWEQLLGIARDNQCVRITFETDRKGFQRAIPGLRHRHFYSAEV